MPHDLGTQQAVVLLEGDAEDPLVQISDLGTDFRQEGHRHSILSARIVRACSPAS
jgi:hypothetical protein